MRTSQLGALSAALLLLAGVAAAADVPTPPASAPETVSGPSDRAERAGEATTASSRKGRLRFRDGPVCICNDGLSERDIRDGGAQRR